VQYYFYHEIGAGIKASDKKTPEETNPSGVIEAIEY